jgi:hypothetical protein
VRGGRVLEAWWELPLLLDSVALIIHDLVALIGNFIIVKKFLAFERGGTGRWRDPAPGERVEKDSLCSGSRTFRARAPRCVAYRQKQLFQRACRHTV